MDELNRLVAASLDAEESLYELLPLILQDLDDLGVRTEHVLDILSQVQLPPNPKILELGCGKGASAQALAEKYHAEVHGFDAMPAFIEHAKKRQPTKGRCHFKIEDVRSVIDQARNYDLVCFLALGDLFGPITETIASLRKCVKPGGLILFDDAYLAEASEADLADFDECYDHDTTITLLTQFTDQIVAERVIDDSSDIDWYRECTTKIANRVNELISEYPQLAKSLVHYGQRQVDDAALMDGPVVGAMWLLRRATN